ncbi:MULTISPECIES: TIGR04283 family arsenosugar biosynthesis glycosyltransferase [Marinobacter]|uniref:TIGR04283 family arsenosugar biosynthesis glycosyltransferase n=1 Tax=Marinobacter TaxID=2742 RepID=UPI0012466790|nr:MULTISPECIES: TIGR04283 family arsenosugar biosynthesis glycosyltransferase [Marinobacter]MBL3557464.1 TIGR04283 family arsenosugar biosynthesis glycosyltransferase [Marinobacter sp. JB05H06]
MSESLSLSVVVPVWREAASIQPFLKSLQQVREEGHEVIVVDGGSDDGTAELAAPWCDQVLIGGKGRALQMNVGAEAAQGNVLLFLHADTVLPDSAFEHLQHFFSSRKQWGRFDVQLSGQRALFRVVAWFMNRRSRLTGIATGDQAMFVRTSVFRAVQGFAPIPLMEDVELSKRLCSLSGPYCIGDPVTTDSRRWEQRGAWRTIFLMWRLRWRYWRGESPESLAAAYRVDVRHADR